MREAKYEIILIDIHSHEIASRYADTLKDAKRIAKRMFSDEYAQSAETTHAAWETSRVEVLDSNGECVYDDFREQDEPHGRPLVDVLGQD